MGEFRHGTKLLLAVALCVSMITSMLVLVPNKAGAAPEDGWIEGTVSDGVNPIPDVLLIYILNMGGGGNPLGYGLTDSLGHYNLTVVGDLSYMVLAFEGNYYSNASTVSAVSGATAIADIIMEPIAPTVADVTLHGLVKDEMGNPVTVGAIIGFTNDPLLTEGGPPYYGNATSPDGLGEYSVNVLAGTAGGGVGIMGVPGYGFIDNSTSNPFVSGWTYWLNITLATTMSTDDAVIRGNVTDSETGMPLGNVLVNFDSSNDWNRDRSYSNYTFTDSLGHYNMNVTNGTSDMMFSKAGYGMYRLSEMSVNAGNNLWINVELLPVTATVSGNVTDASSAPIANAQVFVFDQTMNNISYSVTNSLGKFSFDVFDGTDLRFGAQANGYGSNWSVIDISTGDTIWRDFVLVSFDAWVKGNVTDR
ncbi:MAG: carboxypeptidase-like regulatory domain-containing protein, partial [Candidatus Thermoplasmatota archaeon]|nr:carboxypeptidase-like regulatory domain-containing protein [Candidatus Thermoplasmatota archaeon]